MANEISDDTKKEPANMGMKVVFAGVFVLLVILIMVVIYSRNPTVEQKANAIAPQNQYQNPGIKVDAYSMISNWEQNEINAENKYKGKIVEISGMVDSIGRDILKNAYVTLYGDPYSFNHVQCMVEDENELVNIEADQDITVVGEVSGKALMNIIVRNCHVKK